MEFKYSFMGSNVFWEDFILVSNRYSSLQWVHMVQMVHVMAILFVLFSVSTSQHGAWHPQEETELGEW